MIQQHILIAIAYLIILPSLTYGKSSDFGKLIWSDEFDFLDHCKWKHELSFNGGGNWQFEWNVNNRSNTFIGSEKDNNGKDTVKALWIKPSLTEDFLGPNKTYGLGNFSRERVPYEPFILDIWGAAASDQCTSNAWFGCGPRHIGKNTIKSDPISILPPIRSARVFTTESFSFKYGRIEVRAKLPKGDWLWPAIWMLPEKIKYGTWPSSGEIDIMESRGNENLARDDSPSVQIGVNQIGTTLHWGPYVEANQFLKTHNTKNLPNGELFSEKYHKFILEWTPDGFKGYLDDEKEAYFDVPTKGTWKDPEKRKDDIKYDGYWELSELGKDTNIDNPWKGGDKDAPFDHRFYFILNVAVGGTGVGDGYFPESKTPWNGYENGKTTAKGVEYTSAMKMFWDAHDRWLPSWQAKPHTYPASNKIADHAAMKVDYIRVYEYKDGK